LPPTDPTPMGDILAKLIKQPGPIAKSLEHAQVWDHWEEIVGKAMVPYCRPVWIRDRTLRIEADSSVQLHKLSYRQWDIIKRVNRVARKELISDVYFVLMDDAEG
jgi:predicted nucleic acid-binding Zn ribbon protein